jgi:hypothetical protein
MEGNVIEYFMWSYQQHVQISLQPTMIGVNLSYHMPAEVSQTVQEKLKEFYSKPAVRVKQTLKTLSDRLKLYPSLKNRKSVVHFLDEELSKLEDIVE